MVPVTTITAQPNAPVFKRFRSGVGEHLLVIPHSRIFDVTSQLASAFDQGDPQAVALAQALAQSAHGEVALDQVVAPTAQSISLNVSSSCNLSCGYCYAARGSFEGTQPSPMSWEVARAAIDQLLTKADRLAPITIGFLGGEPFVNRDLIHRVVRYAVERQSACDLDVRFAVTTNGTLLTAADIELLRSHRFAVTVSVDGGAQLHDRQRPQTMPRGGSFLHMLMATEPLLRDPGLAVIAARATVCREDLNISERFAAILAAGFPEVGFAPLRNAPAPSGGLEDNDWPKYLTALTELGRAELARGLQGEPMRLTNFVVALKQLYRGASAPYPCGAGGGYFSVAANGDWYACHRAIGSEVYRMGNNDGLEDGQRSRFLTARHVHAQVACETCWARYLCSGGCHHEASHRTESSCGFVRGWLEFCLSAYCELVEVRKDFFTRAD